LRIDPVHLRLNSFVEDFPVNFSWPKAMNPLAEFASQMGIVRAFPAALTGLTASSGAGWLR